MSANIFIRFAAFLKRHYGIYNIIVCWCFSYLFVRPKSYYYSFLFAFLVQFPFLAKEITIRQHILLYPTYTLQLTTMSLMPTNIATTLFITSLHLDFIQQIHDGSLFAFFHIIIESLIYFYSVEINRYHFILISMNFLTCYFIKIAFKFEKERAFTFTSSCFITFLSTSCGNLINWIIFLSCIFLSIPRLPLNVAPQKLSVQNWKCIIYILFGMIINVICIMYGVKYGALSLVGDSLMSVCNNAAMVGQIIADISTRMKPTKQFSFGKSRALVICDFSVTILLCYITFDLITSSIKSLVEPSEEPYNGYILIVLAFLGLMLNVFGTFFLGSINIKTCSCGTDGNSMSVISDLLSSCAVLLSQLLSKFLLIDMIDPFISLLISFMIIGISLPQMKELIHILMQATPGEMKKSDIIDRLTPNISNIKCNIWELNEDESVLTMETPLVSKSSQEDILTRANMILKNLKITDSTIEINTKPE